MRRLARITLILALAGCQQTVHLYETTHDAAVSATGGQSGKAGTGGGAGYGAGGSNAGGSDQHCSGGPNFLTFTPDSPNVVFAVDRSSSMTNQTFPNSADTHLSAARAAVYSEVSTYSMPHFNRPWMINFSYLDFPRQGSGCSGAGECCADDAVHVSPNDFQTKTACDSSCVATTNRPTSEALHQADEALANANGGSRFVVLISDGNPATQGCTPDDDCLSAIYAVNTLASHHISLYVVAVDGSGSTSCLEDLAMSANGTLHSPSYALASDSNTLGAMIAETVSTTVCNGMLSNAPSSSSSLQVSMTFGSTTTNYPYSPTDGWTYDNGGHLRLHGSLCDAYVQNPMGLAVIAGCAPVHGSGGTGP